VTTLFLATTGGHLTELASLASRVGDGRAVWVTHANEQSRSLLAGCDVEYVPYVGVRNLVDVLRCVPTAHRLWRRRGITRAISTGSGIALGYLPYLAARGVECHYVESAARVRGPSLTGRVLRWVPGVHVYAQYPAWAGGRWCYGGSEFDAYEPVAARREPGATVRVVVTVGTATEFPFRRLVEPLAALLAPDGPLVGALGRPVQVLWQTGATPVADLGISAVPFVPAAELAAALAEADMVVCHAGSGSATSALEAGRRPLVVARRRFAGEAGDDHQAELAAELARRGLALVRDPARLTIEDLLAALGTAVRRVADPPQFELTR